MAKSHIKALAVYLFSLLLLAACSPRTNPVTYSEMRLKQLQDRINQEKLKSQPNNEVIEKAEKELHAKRTQNSLYNKNMRVLSEKMDGHTKMYSLKGKYRVLVIPVQFQDAKMTRPDFFETNSNGTMPAQEYLFGQSQGTLTTYYRHASFGQLDVQGEVAPIVTVPGELKKYGEAVPGNSDVAPRELVKDALLEVMKVKTNPDWWESFDNWDLSDYDSDGTYAESDGFIDAVILVYAGKDQASCQRMFDPSGERPASADYPEGPRKVAAVECFNRIWPHRWSMSISPADPLFQSEGPMVEGLRRPSFNGLKITEKLFALDYNMQSEFSDRSTFMHEFGHSLTLPDIYAHGGENSTGNWELMSSNAHMDAQELSSYSKLSLGWLQPKVVKKGQVTSAYVGAYNFVTANERNPYSDYTGPSEVTEVVDGETHKYSVVSVVPGSGEPVYRSVVVTTDPSQERRNVVQVPEQMGTRSAYSGRFDDGSKSLKFNFDVPEQGDALLKLDIIWGIETDHNFDSLTEDFGMTGDYDIGQIFINGELKEELRMWSGDANLDTLVEAQEGCDVARVKELRLKRNQKTLTDLEKEEFNKKLEICRTPVWLNKAFDLSGYRGKKVALDIRYVTDAGYNEFGIVVDNVSFNGTVADFESSNPQLTDFKLLENGHEIILHNQFYLMEYRLPNESYSFDKQEFSYNMDRNINDGIAAQAMFLPESAESSTPLQRFRLIKPNYQDGLVVWYFNSQFNRIENTPTDFNGKGYLLVLNSKVKELPLPGSLGLPEYFDSEGHYNEEKLLEAIKPQRDEFICFGYTQFATFINGKTPSCTGYAWLDAMLSIKWDGLGLMYRRELINDVYPLDQYKYVGVEIPYRNNASIRTGMGAFRPADAPEMKPLKVFKLQDKQVTIDQELSAQTVAYPPVSEFKDSENSWSEKGRFQSDSVVVEKQGFGFKVVSPDKRVQDRYMMSSDPDRNDHLYRRPRVKILFSWQN